MKKYIYILAFAIFSCNAYAQDITKNGTPANPRFGLYAGYFGDKIANHGYLVGFENYLATTKNFNVIGAVQISNFFASQNFTAVSVLPRVGLRYTANIGLLLESYLGFGYLHRFYSYDEYDVNAQGQVISKGKASQGSATPSICLGLGYDFQKKSSLPMLFFLRGSVNYYYPNKHFLFEASYALETGVTYIPNFKK
jgi:hypothetical protein